VIIISQGENYRFHGFISNVPDASRIFHVHFRNLARYRSKPAFLFSGEVSTPLKFVSYLIIDLSE